MALKKEIKTQYGINASYWRLQNISYNKGDNVLNFILSLFPCKDTAKTEGVVSLEYRSFYFLPENEDFQADIRKACYAHAKSNPEFVDSEDC